MYGQKNILGSPCLPYSFFIPFKIDVAINKNKAPILGMPSSPIYRYDCNRFC
jgi:hypothetical protein